MIKNNIIVFVKNWYGGTGFFVDELLTIKSKKIRFITLSLQRPISNKATIISYERKLQFDKKLNGLPTFFYEFFKQVMWLDNNIKKYNPKIIITVDLHCLIMLMFTVSFYKRKIRIISTIHNNLKKVIESKIHYPISLLGFYIASKLIRRCDAIVCPSYSLSNHLFNFFKLEKPPITVYYSFSKYAKYLKIYNLPKKSTNNIVLTVCRLVEQKDLMTLIKAFKIVKSRIKGVSLLVIGDGYLRKTIMQYIKDHRIKGVHMYGWKKNVNYYYQKADLFVLSSNWEGFGIAIVEGMLNKLPIIASNTPFGPSELIGKNEYGVLVPMHDIKKLADTIINFLTDKYLYHHYSIKSFERAKFFLNYDMKNRYKKLINELLDD